MAARTDSAILHEIVRVIQERAQVPEKVRIRTKQYLITYLEDHRQRLEEAMRRHDSDRLGMLFGQLPGRIKYQMMKASRKAKPAGRAVAKNLARPASKSGSGPASKSIAKPAKKPAPKPSAKAKPKAKAVARGVPKPKKSAAKPKAKTAARVSGKRRARA